MQPKYINGTNLDSALDAYSAQSRAIKRPGLAHAAAYTAAAGAALALAPSADAAIQEVTIANGSRLLTATVTSTQYLTIKLGTDLIDDIRFKIYGNPGSFASLRAIPLNGAAVRVEGDVKRLVLGDTVGPANAFNTISAKIRSAIATSNGVLTGGWTGNSSAPGHVGLRFLNIAGSVTNTHYGWIRLSVTNDGSGYPIGFTADYGVWEDAPNTAVGVLIPEPSPAAGLALLAAGAVGVGAWRRRKQPNA